jgi:dinuclear metal center YbgI/SA1388 family protein
MPNLRQISEFLDRFAPTRLAESWDNVGLLVGDPDSHIERVMTCLTITPETVSEAVEQSAQLIVTHHPLPFHSLKRITTETIPSRMLLQLIRADIAVYSPHTGFDSAFEGINQLLAQRIGLEGIRPLKTVVDDPEQLGSGRFGTTSIESLAGLLALIKRSLGLKQILFTGDLTVACKQVAVACGSGGSFLSLAANAGCDTFVTGETNFHTCLEARARNISLVMLGHYASERFAVEHLATRMAREFGGLEIWASRAEQDPVQFG